MAIDQRPVLLPAGSSPRTWLVDGSGTVDYRSAFAHYNGAAAAGSFKVALTIKGQDGTILGRFPSSETLAAGDSADVTFAPFLKASTATGGGGIDFDTYPQSGTWFYMETTGTAGSPFGRGWQVESVGPVELESTGDEVRIDADQDLNLGSTNGRVLTVSDGDTNMDVGRDVNMNVDRDLNGTAQRDVVLRALAEMTLRAANDTVMIFGGNIIMRTLPTADPGVPNALWNNGGVVTVSP